MYKTIQPCPCGRIRRRNSESGLCSYCQPTPRHKGFRAKTDRSNGMLVEAKRKPHHICPRCCDLPHARDKKGCLACGKPHGEIPILPMREVLGSSGGWAT